MPFNLPETMISMAAIAVGFTVFVEHLDNSRSETTAYDTSTVVLEFLDAAQAYAAQRHVPLNAAIAGAGGQPVLVTRSALVGSGYLAPSFPTTTSFGATLSAYVRRNPSADPADLGVACSTYSSSQGTCPLEVMVVTAGGIVPRADVRGAVMRFGETKIGEVGASNVARGQTGAHRLVRIRSAAPVFRRASWSPGQACQRFKPHLGSPARRSTAIPSSPGCRPRSPLKMVPARTWT